MEPKMKKTSFIIFLLASFFVTTNAFADFIPVAARTNFDNMNVTTEYSDLLKEKMPATILCSLLWTEIRLLQKFLE